MTNLHRISGRCAATLVLLVSVLSSGSALAWEREMHVSIVEAAMQLSPAAEARVPNEFREAFYHEIGEADLLDRECRYHASLTGNRDAAAMAEKIYAELTNPAHPMKPYPRAQAMGRYAHYVADAVVPNVLRGENVANHLPNFFANRNFVLYRERQPLTLPLAASLRERGAAVSWNSNQEAGSTAIFRLAVNVMADALMLFPPRAGSEQVADAGPVIFVVNRMDNGVAAHQTRGYVATAKTTQMEDIGGPYQWVTSGSTTSYSWSYEEHGGGGSSKKSNLMEKGGVHIAEMNIHQKATGSTLRALLFNNSDYCAADVVLKMGTWKWTLPDTMPPRALRMVEVELPEALSSRKLTSSFSTQQCPGKLDMRAFLSTDRRLVIGNTGTAPRFLGVAAEINLTDSRGTSKALVN